MYIYAKYIYLKISDCLDEVVAKLSNGMVLKESIFTLDLSKALIIALSEVSLFGYIRDLQNIFLCAVVRWSPL